MIINNQLQTYNNYTWKLKKKPKQMNIELNVQNEGEPQQEHYDKSNHDSEDILNALKKEVESNPQLKDNLKLRKSITQLEQMDLSGLQEREKREKLEQQKFEKQKLWDKLTFVRSIIIIILFFFFLGLSPAHIFTYFYVIVTIYLMIKRFYMWVYKKWLLYFFELCYYGNILVCVYLWGYGNNRTVWLMTYTLNTGIMAMAMIVFTNSVVFTSIEHMISLFIHAGPVAVCWMVRWRATIWNTCQRNDHFQLIDLSNEQFDWSTVSDMIAYTCLFYAIWVAYYIIFCYGLCGNLALNGWSNGCFDNKYTKGMSIIKRRVGYLLFHFCMFVVGTIFALLVYWNIWVHSIYILIMYFLTFYNGGRYYTDVFSKRYNDQIKKQIQSQK